MVLILFKGLAVIQEMVYMDSIKRMETILL